MIELRTNPDYLHTLAADTREAGRDETAKDLDNAAHDIKNLRDYGYTLERTTNEASAEIQKWKDKAADYQGMAEARESNYNAVCEQRDAAAAALLAIFRPELDAMIKDAIQSVIGERLDDMQGDLNDMQDKVDDIPSEDDINDAVREFMQYEAKFRVTLE